MNEVLNVGNNLSFEIVVSAEVEAKYSAWVAKNFPNGVIGLEGETDLDADVGLDGKTGLADDAKSKWFSQAMELYQFCLGMCCMGLGVCVPLGEIRKKITECIHAIQKLSYRSRYYEKENKKRRLHAIERRKIKRRSTTNKCPSPEEFTAAFATVKQSLSAKIRFGGMVHDLECYVDNFLKIDKYGEIVGRERGIKGWLQNNMPELLGRYKTALASSQCNTYCNS